MIKTPFLKSCKVLRPYELIVSPSEWEELWGSLQNRCVESLTIENEGRKERAAFNSGTRSNAVPHGSKVGPELRVFPSWLYGTAELTRYAEHSCTVTEQLAWKLTFACFLNCGLFIFNAFNWSGWFELEPSDIFAFFPSLLCVFKTHF